MHRPERSSRPSQRAPGAADVARFTPAPTASPAFWRRGEVPRVRVAVCVATYRRPIMLAALMESLGELAVDTSALELVLVVVSNDAGEQPASVLRSCHADFPWPVVGAVEPERNIALARNRCVRIALDEGADWVVFVDDDERVGREWLNELLRVQRECAADVVAGPVVNAYSDSAPRWMVESGMPFRYRRVTGPASPVADTSNVLIARRVFEMVPEHFDPRFGRSGGSDSLFFMRARAAGATIAWADEAFVHETLPASRTTVSWILRRAFRIGNAGVFVARSALPAWRWLPRRAAAAGYRIVRGLVLLPPAVVQGRAAIVRALQDLSVGAGAVAGLLGYRYIEYTQSHGA